MSGTREILEDVGERFRFPDDAFERFGQRLERKRRHQRVAAAVVGLAVVFATVVLVAVGLGQVSEVPAGPDPQAPPSSGFGRASGLPPEGSTPSDPTPGHIALSVDGSDTGSTGPSLVRVFADGRVVWHRWYSSVSASSSTGFVERRLTPEAVDELVSTVTETGLFDEDFVLAKPADGTYLTLAVRAGDRLVQGVWAPRLWWNVGAAAEDATDEEERVLGRLFDELGRPETWDERMWTDEVSTYVPNRYEVCLRAFGRSVAATSIADLLPDAARDLLGADTWSHDEPACGRVSAASAPVLDRVFTGAGWTRTVGTVSEPWLHYATDDPERPGTDIVASFGPVLPDGQAVFLGPG